MAMYYYYIDGETKKGPYTIAELQALNLPVETLIWSDGWTENKPISECPEVMDFFALNPPAIPDDKQTTDEATLMPQAVDETNEEDEMRPIYPDMHWLPKTIMYFGILAVIRQFIMAFADNTSGLAIAIDIAFVIWGGASIFGMLDKKKWGLISYFSYRAMSFILLIMFASSGDISGDDFVKDFFSLILIMGLFLIKKDGYNVYELLWNNGVFYVKKEKPVDEEAKEENEITNTETSEENQ